MIAGLDTPDDAAVWRIDDTRGIVITTDFFTPVVDDPYDYGAIAAANSLSDVYAMGGKPFLALNIAALPPQLPNDFLSEILRGGAEKTREAGAVIAGGHTIQDNEPKFGLVALGFVQLDQVMQKSGARPGQRLILTKPLGFGTITTALKQQKADPQDVAEAVRWMSRLNNHAADLAIAASVHGGTDITGFGFLGHAYEMAAASQVHFVFYHSSIPFLPCSDKYAKAFIFPGGAWDNQHFYNPHIDFSETLSEVDRMRLFDPQTSGGLLFAVDDNKVDPLLRQAESLKQPAWVIGEVTEGSGISVI